MKKLLAILTALVMAVSIAVGNVCAVNFDQEILPISGVHTEKIPLYPVVVSDTKTIETQITIPAYALNAYMTPEYYLSLNLPAGMPGTVYNSTEVSLIAKGVEYQLKPMTVFSIGGVELPVAVYENKISFGALTHSYNEVTDDTVIPASNEFGDYTSLTVVIRRTVSDTYDISKDAELFAEGGDYAFSACLKLCSASDGSEVVGTTSYGQSWTVTSKLCIDEAEGFEFVTVDFNKTKQINLAWDHTLEARRIVENAKAIKVVIKLAEPLNGMAFYDMVTAEEKPLYWWQYANYLARYELDGSSDELVFDISMEKLGDMPEAAENLSFNINENIMLWNTDLMSDYMHINRKYIEEQGLSSPQGSLSWTDEDDRVCYKDNPVNYADGGFADPYGASVRAIEAYMEVTVADPVTVNLGDVNNDGKVTLEDAVQTLKRAMNVDVGNEAFIEEAADVVVDGKISLEDAIEILKMAMNVAG